MGPACAVVAKGLSRSSRTLLRILVIDALDEIAAETGKTIPQIALNWLLQRPTVSTVLIGTRNEEQLRQNLGAVGWSLIQTLLIHRRREVCRRASDSILAEAVRDVPTCTRNGHPYSSIDLDRDKGVQDLLDRFHVAAADVPVLICRGEVVLRNPTNEQIADCLGFNDAANRDRGP